MRPSKVAIQLGGGLGSLETFGAYLVTTTAQSCVTTLVNWWYNRDITVIGLGIRASHRAVFLVKKTNCF